MRLEKHGAGEAIERGGDGGVEPLQVACRDDAAEATGLCDEGVGFGKGCSERLFDQDIEAGLKELVSHLGVRAGGYTDRGGVQIQGCREQVVQGCKREDVVASRSVGACFRVRVDDRSQPDGTAVGRIW